MISATHAMDMAEVSLAMRPATAKVAGRGMAIRVRR